MKRSDDDVLIEGRTEIERELVKIDRVRAAFADRAGFILPTTYILSSSTAKPAVSPTPIGK